MPKKRFSSFAFHRALRKRLDGDASSICWNAIYLLKCEDWDAFCEAARSQTGTLKARLKGVLPYGEHARTLFLIGLRMLSDEEWEILEEYAMLPLEDKDEDNSSER